MRTVDYPHVGALEIQNEGAVVEGDSRRNGEVDRLGPEPTLLRVLLGHASFARDNIERVTLKNEVA